MANPGCGSADGNARSHGVPGGRDGGGGESDGCTLLDPPTCELKGGTGGAGGNGDGDASSEDLGANTTELGPGGPGGAGRRTPERRHGRRSASAALLLAPGYGDSAGPDRGGGWRRGRPVC